MALNGLIPVVFEDVFPHGALVSGQVDRVKDWDRSTQDKFVQAEAETLDPDSGEVVSLPLWRVVILDADPDLPPEALQVHVVARHQPVLPEPVPGMPFRPVVLDGLAIEAKVNRDKCKAPWGGRQHRCSARVVYGLWARGLRAPAAPVRAGAGNGKASG